MAANTRCDPNARTQIIRLESLPTRPGDIQCRSARRRPGRVSLRVPPVLLYFLSLALVWAGLTQCLLKPARASAAEIRRRIEERLEAVDGRLAVPNHHNLRPEEWGCGMRAWTVLDTNGAPAEQGSRPIPAERIP